MLCVCMYMCVCLHVFMCGCVRYVNVWGVCLGVYVCMWMCRCNGTALSGTGMDLRATAAQIQELLVSAGECG